MLAELVAALMVFAFGCGCISAWHLRGWYDRRMKPTLPELEAETTGRIGKRWAESLASIAERQS